MLHFPGERVAASFFGRPARKGYFLPEGLNPDTLEGGSAVGAHPFLEFIFQNGKSGAFDQQLPAPPAVCIVALAHDIAEVNVAQACSGGYFICHVQDRYGGAGPVGHMELRVEAADMPGNGNIDTG